LAIKLTGTNPTLAIPNVLLVDQACLD